jgi:hypothetical protein
LRARKILIGNIVEPSYSPGIGNEVTIKTRIALGSIRRAVVEEAQA